MRDVLIFLSIAAVTAGLASPSWAGSIRICASDLTNFDDTPRLDIPAGLVFAAWGRPAGSQSADLRSMRLDPNYPPARQTGQTAIVVTAPVTLTADAPCAVARVDVLASPRHAWRGQKIAPGDGTVYQALDTLAGTDMRPLSSEPHALYDLLTMNVLVAQVIEPVSTMTTIR